MTANEPRPGLWGLTAAGLAALAVVAGHWDPVAHPGPTLCLFKRATGLDCPACGLTRAAALAARGEFTAALAMNPGVFVVAAAVAAAWLVWGLRLATGRRWLAGWEPRLALGVAGVLVAIWAARWSTGTLPP